MKSTSTSAIRLPLETAKRRGASSVSRRRFVQTGAAAGLAVAARGVSADDPAKPIRMGIIGVGGRGSGLLSTLMLFPQVRITAVCDLLPERAAQAGRMVQQKQGHTPAAYTGSELAWEKMVTRDDLDGVLIATPWTWHARMAVGAMRAGKCPGVEVPAAITLEECWDLVRTSEQTGVPCMMLENVCYFENVLAVLRMVREGLFGQLQHCEAGYQHDCRFLLFDDKGELTWRGKHVAAQNGNLYPTHPLGPVGQWMNLNCGDRLVSLTSVSTQAVSLGEFAAKRFGPNHPAAKRKYALGDVNTTLLTTANGRTVTLYFNLLTHRPYDLIFRVEGVRGIYLGTTDKICLESSKSAEQWEPFAPYQQRYEHPLWKAMRTDALKSGGHGGAEYLMFHDFLKAVRTKTAAPQDVYDAAAWSAVYPLSIASVAQGGRQVEFPDFTTGRWKTKPPLPIYGV